MENLNHLHISTVNTTFLNPFPLGFFILCPYVYTLFVIMFTNCYYDLLICCIICITVVFFVLLFILFFFENFVIHISCKVHFNRCFIKYLFQKLNFGIFHDGPWQNRKSSDCGDVWSSLEDVKIIFIFLFAFANYTVFNV